MTMLNKEAIEKFMEAKKLEKEALKMMLPEKMAGHIEIISNEMKAMLLDVLSESVNNKEKESEVKKTVKKVNIS